MNTEFVYEWRVCVDGTPVTFTLETQAPVLLGDIVLLGDKPHLVIRRVFGTESATLMVVPHQPAWPTSSCTCETSCQRREVA